MKLHVYFDNEDNGLPIDKNDFYFVTSASLHKKLIEKGLSSFLCIPLSFNDYEKYDYNNIAVNFVKQIDSRLEMFYNTVYVSLIIPISNVLFSLKDQLQRNIIDVIELYGGSDYPFFSLIGTEGEGKKFLYKREWMMNYIIYQSFKDEYNIVWNNKDLKIKVRYIHWFRENKLFLFKLFHCFIRSLLCFRDKQNYIHIKGEEKYNLYLCPMKLQFVHLNKISKESTVGSYFISNIEGNASYKLPSLNISYFFKVLKNIHFKTNNLILDIPAFDRSIHIHKSLKLSFKYLLLSYMYSREQYFLLNKRTQLLEKANFFINNKTIGPDAYLDAELSRFYKKKLITFQYVTMSLFNFPCHKVFDKIYVYSKKLKEAYIKYGIDVDLYKENKCYINERDNGRINITIFLQPDHFDDYSLNASVNLARAINSVRDKFHLYIKPHYRQTNIDVISYSLSSDKEIKDDCYTMLSKEDDIPTILQYTNLCISFTSSVLVESINSGVPTVSIIVNDTVKETISKYDMIDDYCWYVYGIDKVSEIIDDYPRIVRRYIYLINHNEESGLEVSKII